MLTDRAVKTAPPGRHGDAAVRGLMLVVKPSGSRSWLLRYQLAGRRRDMGLGPYPEITLARAREKALQARRLVKEGIDPLSDRRATPPTTPHVGTNTIRDEGGPSTRREPATEGEPADHGQGQAKVVYVADCFAVHLADAVAELLGKLSDAKELWDRGSRLDAVGCDITAAMTFLRTVDPDDPNDR